METVLLDLKIKTQRELPEKFRSPSCRASDMYLQVNLEFIKNEYAYRKTLRAAHKK